MSEADNLLVMECPSCGRLWIGRFRALRNFGRQPPQDTFTAGEVETMRGSHSPPGPWKARDASSCFGVPESVSMRPDIEAAYLIGGKEAAEALTSRSFGIALEEYEERSKSWK